MSSSCPKGWTVSAIFCHRGQGGHQLEHSIEAEQSPALICGFGDPVGENEKPGERYGDRISCRHISPESCP
jgi:hypothetical protein